MAESIRVLHVDDEPGFAELTADHLERFGDFTVETATNVRTAAEILSTTPIDCIVSDYDMPGTDGIQFLRSVREDEPGIPFILFTGKGSEEVASTAISAGVTDYMQKTGGPDQFELLANRIMNVVDATRSREQLTERTRRLETLIETLPGVVYRCANKPDWPIESIEGEVTELTGYSIEDFESGRISLGNDLIHPEDRDTVWQEVQSALAENEFYEITYRIETADGTVQWVWERGRGVFADDTNSGDRIDLDPDTDSDELIALEGFIMALSDRMKNERDLARSRARYRALCEQSPDIIIVHDDTGTITEINAAGAEKLGYERDKLLGMDLWELDQSIDVDAAAEFWESLSEDESPMFESTLIRNDGSELPVEVHLSRLETGAGKEFLAIVRDIRTRRAREEQLEAQSAELKRQNERLETFADVLAHDIPNHLTMAAGYLELAWENEDLDYLDRVKTVHERIETLVDDMKTLLRTGEPVDELEWVRVSTVAETCWRHCCTTMDPATLTVETDGEVLADRSRLRQLFENLFWNTCDHAGTDVVVRVGLLADGFFVADDGPGIPAEEREAVVEPGYSMGGPDHAGLGLTIVREIAEAHGWELSIGESVSGGARFEFTGVDTRTE